MKTKLNSEHADDTEKKWNPKKGSHAEKNCLQFFFATFKQFQFFLLSIVDVFKNV